MGRGEGKALVRRSVVSGRYAKRAKPYRRTTSASFGNTAVMRPLRRPGKWECGPPSQMEMTLAYYGAHAYAPGAAYYNFLYRGNDVRDPDYSGAGHQPMWFDQMMAIYTRFEVLASEIAITVTNHDAVMQSLTVYPGMDATAPASIEEAMERKYAKTIDVAPETSGVSKTLTHKCSMNQLYGSGDAHASEGTGDTTNSPTKQFFWQLWFASVAGGNITGNFRVALKYRVRFFEPRAASTS